MFVKAPDVTYFWRRQAPFERFKRELPGGSGGMLPQEIFKKEHSETLFPALETKYQFPRQGQSSLKFSLKSKMLNENGFSQCIIKSNLKIVCKPTVN